MQHGAEDFALQLVQVLNLDQRGRDEGAMFCGRRVHGRLVHGVAAGAQGVDVALDARLRFGVDHGADVGGQGARVGHAGFGHGALEHGDGAVGHVVLQAQHAQGRAALPGGIEGRGHHVLHHLFGQGRAVDDHGVLPAGFGDQRHGLTAGVQAPGQLALQQARHFGGAGEHHAAHARIAHQRRAHAGTVAGQQLQRGARHARVQQRAHGGVGDQRGLLGRLGQHHVARGQRGGHLAGEDGQRKVPRADAHHRAQRRVGGVVQLGGGLVRVEAQKVDGFAHFGDGVGPAFAGLAHQQAHQLRHIGLQCVGGAVQGSGALGRGHGGPGGGVRLGGGQGVGHVGIRRVGHVAHHVALIGRVAHGRGGQGRGRVVHQRGSQRWLHLRRQQCF